MWTVYLYKYGKFISVQLFEDLRTSNDSESDRAFFPKELKTFRTTDEIIREANLSGLNTEEVIKILAKKTNKMRRVSDSVAGEIKSEWIDSCAAIKEGRPCGFKELEKKVSDGHATLTRRFFKDFEYAS
jgi:hypothetical protein